MTEAKQGRSKYRIGIDVGGTFTKAALIDNATHDVVARTSVHTTHADPRGVAAGVVAVFQMVLKESGVAPDQVVFLAHSTTQATNALLEGDVAKVGIIGLAGKNAAKLAEPQVHVGAIELAPGRSLLTANRFLPTEDLDAATVRNTIDALIAEGAEVLVASAAFGVDNTGSEELVRRIGLEAGRPTTCGHEITRLYGLSTRTRTAVINASILPRMIATANMTEASVREAGIKAPLMIMRGDGGVMDIHEMHRRPAMTMLSGPAASVAGALMHLRVSDGIYFEVGGTSTNIAVIQGGRPSITYARVGGHETYVNSLDVRVIGIAGGSLIRATTSGLVDVGPRSAHIAGLPYAAFADPRQIRDAIVEPFEPKPGDGRDYIAIRTASGERFALTTTCAANALGLTAPDMHSHGNRQAARNAFAALGSYLGTDIDTVAHAVLERATDKVLPVIDDLIKHYNLDPDQRLLIGVGGGAGALVPMTAKRTDLRFEIARDAEIISSIGAALAMVREVIERIIPHPSPEDLQAVRQEALAAAIRLGADADSVDVTIEIDRLTQRVRAIAIGSAELRTSTDEGVIVEAQARDIAARSLAVPKTSLHLAGETSGCRVYLSAPEQPTAVRVIDWEGNVRVQRSRALVRQTTAADARAAVAQLWSDALALGHDTKNHPGLIILFERHVVDLSGIETLEQALALTESELQNKSADLRVVIVALPR
jgi:N-methylhydantoinase A